MYEYDYSDPCLENRCLLVLVSSVICTNCKRGNISRLAEGKNQQNINCPCPQEVSVNAMECNALSCLLTHCKCALCLHFIVSVQIQSAGTTFSTDVPVFYQNNGIIWT